MKHCIKAYKRLSNNTITINKVLCIVIIVSKRFMEYKECLVARSHVMEANFHN